MPGNPFRGYLQTYLQNMQVQHQQEQAEKAHELAVNQLEELHQYHQGELKRQQAELDHNKNVAGMTLKQHLMENLASGLQQPPDNSQVTGFQANYDQPSVDSGGNLGTGIPTSLSKTGNSYQLSPEDLGGLASGLSPADRQINVASPEKMAQLAAQRTSATEGAKVAAEEPVRASQRTIAETRANATEQAATTRAQTAQSIAESKNAALIDRMSHIDATRKYVADHNFGSTVDEGELSNYVDKVANGEADLKDIPAKFRVHAQAVLGNQGKAEFSKAKGDQLNSLNDMDGLIQDMHTAANMLPDSNIPGVNQLQQFGNKNIIGHLPWQTDLTNAMAAVSAKAPGIVRSIGGVGSGRVTNVEIQQKLKDMVNAGMTKTQAEGKIAQFERDTYTKAYSDILGSIPSAQQKLSILSKHGGLDRWRNMKIRVRDPQSGQPVETPVIKKMPNGHEAIWDTNNNQYKDIEDYK